jgi:hypothetical protein
MVRVDGARQRFRRALPEAVLDRKPFGPHFVQPQFMRPFSGDDNEVDAVGQEGSPCPKAFTAEPLDAVSAHGIADLARDDHTQPRGSRRGPLCGHEQREVGGADPATPSLRAHELGVPAQPPITPEPEGHYFL